MGETFDNLQMFTVKLSPLVAVLLVQNKVWFVEERLQLRDVCFELGEISVLFCLH